MNMKKTIITLSAMASLVFLSQARAVTVHYTLDQSDSLPDGIDYVNVSISDSTSGQLDFRVDARPVLSRAAGEDFGIQSFAFNSSVSANTVRNNVELPDGWRVPFIKTMGEAGEFDVKISTDSARLDPLEFSVRDLTLEDVESFFAAKVADFYLEGTPGVTEAYFYGGSPVPIPAAVWLFGSGLLGLVGVARRRRD